jgi:uncharacterized protein involved in exopolysaccharide biosynthesis
VISRERSSTDRRNEIDLAAMWRVALSHKYIVMATCALCVAVAVVLALKATPIYRAEVIMTEVRESEVGGAGSLATQLGGLASIAGVNLGDTGQDHERQAVLQSRHLIEEFVKRNGLLPLLFRGSKQPPSLWFAVERFRKRVVLITQEKLKGITTVSIDWTDPATAASWANGFVALANELIRTRAIDTATRNVDYLSRQIAQTNVLGVQQAMYNLIESETKTLMLANARREYAFSVVDPAVPPEVRISPRRTLMVLTGGLIGLILGAIMALVYDRWNRPRRAEPVPVPSRF